MHQVLDSSTATHQTANESGNMLTNGSNQYIQPDYLSPLPTTLDSKRSPLALLAQTCSQIGADPTPSTTSATTTLPSTSSTSVTKSADKATKNKSELYANDKTSNRKTPPQSSKQHYLDPYGRHETKETESKSGFKSPSTSKSSTSPSINATQQQQQQQLQDSSKLLAEQRIALDMAMQQQQNQLSKDIQQSMMANAAAYHHRPSPVFPSPLSSLSVGVHHPLSAYHHPGLAGLDAATAAALGAFRHPAYSSVAHHLGYPHHVPVSLGLSLASYQQALSAVSYGQRLQQQQQQQHSNSTGKTGDSSAICRDPYCTGCPNSSPSTNAMPVSSSSSLSSSSSSSSSSPNTSPTTTTTASTSSTSSNSCPAGCSQCDHVTRTTSAAAAATHGAGLGLTSSTAALSSSLSMSTSTPSTIVTSPSDSLLRPYVCNWIASDHYCGKRFASSDELLQHLRTHTSLSVASQLPPAVVAPPEPSLSSPSSSIYSSPHHHHHHQQQLLNPSLHPHSAHLLAASAAALHRTYPTPPLSPLSMARYHPYGNTGGGANANKHLNSTGPLQQHSPLSSSVPPPPSASIAPPPPPPPSTHNPLLSLHHPYAASLAGLPGYYSTHPYSLYSQRMLAGAGVLP